MVNLPTRTVLTLREYEARSFPAAMITEEAAVALVDRYGKRITVEWPSYQTRDQWRLTSQGWVGYLPVSASLALSLVPRVPLGNLFRMLEYAFDLRAFAIMPELFESATLPDAYERLALILARRILTRGRKGFARAYVRQTARLPYVRGRLDVAHVARAPWDAQPQCTFDEHTADIPDNQILLWTLSVILRGDLCTERSLPTIRQAYRALHGTVSEVPSDARGRVYHPLNADYQLLHALCAFFLDGCGPDLGLGRAPMLAFLVAMPRLFEEFVVAWLREHLPPQWRVEAQERVTLTGHPAAFDLDIVLYDRATGAARFVLDTKYKLEESTADLTQIIAYAQMKRCNEAVLVYPDVAGSHREGRSHDIHVRSLPFALGGDLEANGQAFLRQILTRARDGERGDDRNDTEDEQDHT